MTKDDQRDNQGAKGAKGAKDSRGDQGKISQDNQGRGSVARGDETLPVSHKARSTSLLQALAALEKEEQAGQGAEGQSRPAQSKPAQKKPAKMPPPKAQMETDMSDKKQQPSSPQEDAQTAAGKEKTRIFGGSNDELKYHQEPVVGWLVVVGGPGLGAHRPIFMGSNTIGSDPDQRIPIDFGDEFISREEQAYIRYDGDDRQFLFIPNLAKANVVSIDDVKPTSAVRLAPYDVISMGNTKLVFIPFCGEEFDWSDLPA